VTPSYTFVKRCSFAHSAIYAALLVAWAIPGAQTAEMIFGFGHGIGWFFMVGLSFWALARRVIPFSLAVLISVGGAIGPFIGSAAFVWRDRTGAADGRPRVPSSVQR
jgi:hypothetical protein